MSGPSATEFRYNSLGQRISMKYSVGGAATEEVTYQYRDDERLWKKIAPQGTMYEYAENGKVKKIAFGTHVVTYDWDARGRLGKVALDMPAGSAATSYKYEPLGNLQEMVYPNGLKSELDTPTIALVMRTEIWRWNGVSAMDTPQSEQSSPTSN